MEINAEISKVFGTEMAKLFAETISEDELRNEAEKTWRELKKKEYWSDLSTIDKCVRETILN